MKKYLYFLFAAFVAVGLSACSPDEDEPYAPDTEVPTPTPDPDPTSGKTLIVYYSFTNNVHTIADYDRIIVGAPLWWSNMAAPLQTFLFQYGSLMEGKSIGLIVSSSSSGISGVESDARRLIPGGDFLEPSLWIRSGQTSNCHSMIADWLSQIN